MTTKEQIKQALRQIDDIYNSFCSESHTSAQYLHDNITNNSVDEFDTDYALSCVDTLINDTLRNLVIKLGGVA